MGVSGANAIADRIVTSEKALEGARYFVSLLLDAYGDVRRVTVSRLASWPQEPPFSEMRHLDVYAQILKETVALEMDVVDVLLRAVVLHTHSIVLSESVVLEDVKPGAGSCRVVLAPLTRRHLAELLSALWEGRGERGSDRFWSEQYSTLTGYELFSDIPPELLARAITARDAIRCSTLVAELIEE